MWSRHREKSKIGMIPSSGLATELCEDVSDLIKSGTKDHQLTVTLEKRHYIYGSQATSTATLQAKVSRKITRAYEVATLSI